MTAAYDLHFYFDPVCPFAWMTSKWVRMVAEQREYRVDWRFISLRILNAHIDYDAHFPPEYEAGHTAGLRLLRVAARTRAEHGRAAVGSLYSAIGTRIFDTSREVDPLSGADQGARRVLEPLLHDAGLPSRAGRRAGRHVVRRRDPRGDRGGSRPDGPRRRHADPALPAAGRHGVLRPGDQPAAQPRRCRRLWDHVVALAEFGGFAELKRSLRERPQLASFGVDTESVGKQEDWHGGSRRLKK